jgi:hypothetical protein
MSTQKFIRRAAGFAFALTFAGAAFARQPPALVEAQAAEQSLEQTSGYREAYARKHQSTAANAYAAAGYRDSLVRLSF